MDSSKDEIGDIKKNYLYKITSKFILKKIFLYLHEKRSLLISHFNKKLQNGLNKSLEDYKKGNKKYSLIEIEIIPTKNELGKFINILNKKYEPCYHIYFNDSKEEIKRNNLIKDDNVTKVEIKIAYQVKSFSLLFFECKCIESILFKKFYRNNIFNMNNMFSRCSSLKVINFSNFNTDNVTDMSDMFSECTSLKELNLIKFNTGNVKNMSNMFNGCSSLTELNLSNFNTNKVIDMSYMFYGCSLLKEILLSNFVTSNVTNMICMFYQCSSLKEIDVSNFIINENNDIWKMFYGCSDDLKQKIKIQNKQLDIPEKRKKFIIYKDLYEQNIFYNNKKN